MSPHKKRLLDEICEQPGCLARLVEAFPDNFESLRLPGGHTQKLIGIGEGSSYNALKIAAPFIEEFTGVSTFTFDPESLENKFEIAGQVGRPFKHLFENSFFLTVSQSGKTASIVKTMGHVQDSLGFSDNHAPMIPFTNNSQGTLGQTYNNHFDLSAGIEESIAATKSMTASIMSLLLFGLRYGQKRDWLKRSLYPDFLRELKDIPEALEHMLADENFHGKVKAYCKRLCETNQFVLLSRGILSLILPEVGLKLTETSRNIVWTDNTESFKHGRKVILHGVQGERPNCVYLIPPNLSPEEAEQLFTDIHSHFYIPKAGKKGGFEKVFDTDGVFFVIFENSPVIPDSLREALNINNEDILVLPQAEGIESIFVGLVGFQLLTYYLALAKGEDPNNPALQKAVLR